MDVLAAPGVIQRQQETTKINEGNSENHAEQLVSSPKKILTKSDFMPHDIPSVFVNLVLLVAIFTGLWVFGNFLLMLRETRTSSPMLFHCIYGFVCAVLFVLVIKVICNLAHGLHSVFTSNRNPFIIRIDKIQKKSKSCHRDTKGMRIQYEIIGYIYRDLPAIDESDWHKCEVDDEMYVVMNEDREIIGVYPASVYEFGPSLCHAVAIC